MEKEHRDRHVKEAVAKAIASLEKDVERRTVLCAGLVEEAVANERERCAKVCDELAEKERQKFRPVIERDSCNSDVLRANAAFHDTKTMAFEDVANEIRGETE